MTTHGLSVVVDRKDLSHYCLMKRSDGAFLVRSPYDDHPEYYLGRDWAKSRFIVRRLNEAHRPNIENREDGLYVCFNLHARSDTCEYEKIADAEVTT